MFGRGPLGAAPLAALPHGDALSALGGIPIPVALFDSRQATAALWSDQTDAENNAAQASVPNQPAIISADFGAVQGVRFVNANASGQGLSSVHVANASGTGGTFFVLFKTASTKTTSAYAGDAPICFFGNTAGSVDSSFGLNNGVLEWRFFDTAWRTVSGGSALNNGAIHTAAVTHDLAGNVRLYVDGSLVTSSSPGTFPYAGLTWNYVGHGFDGLDSFDGDLGLATAWDLPLLAGDISALHTAAMAIWNASSSTNYVRGVSETTSVSDAVARVLAPARSATETVSVSDAVARVAHLARGVSETITSSEAVARAVASLRGVSETTASSDAVASQDARVRGVSETTSVSDAIARSLGAVRGSTETTSVSDAVASVKLKIVNISETVAGSDTVARVLATFRGVSETVASSESATAAKVLIRGVTETVTSSDTVARVVHASRGISETVTSSDTVARVLSTFRGVSETVSSSETVTSLKLKIVGVTETVTSSDTVARVVHASRGITETVTGSDTVARALVTFRGLSETVASSETVAKVVTRGRAVAETVTVSDAVARVVHASRGVAETVTGSDSVARARALLRSVTETVTSSETVAKVVTRGRAVVENISVSDIVSYLVTRSANPLYFQILLEWLDHTTTRVIGVPYRVVSSGSFVEARSEVPITYQTVKADVTTSGIDVVLTWNSQTKNYQV